MARRRLTVTDLINSVYKLPWRIGIGLAVLSFLVLHFVADIFEEPSSAANTGGTGSELVQSAMYTLAMILQFIVPIGLSIAAAVSFLKQSKTIRRAW